MTQETDHTIEDDGFDKYGFDAEGIYNGEVAEQKQQAWDPIMSHAYLCGKCGETWVPIGFGILHERHCQPHVIALDADTMMAIPNRISIKDGKVTIEFDHDPSVTRIKLTIMRDDPNQTGVAGGKP